MPRLTKKALLKHLHKSDKDDIIGEVITLFDKFKNVKEFYSAELSDEANPLLEQYKKKIAKAYASANPKEKTTNINVNRLINQFKKVSIYERELADLMIFRVECGVDAFTHNNKRSATFYNCIAATFEDAVKLIVANGYINEFRKRIDKIVHDSESGKYEIAERLADIVIEIIST
jgi:hypothetical protein